MCPSETAVPRDLSLFHADHIRGFTRRAAAQFTGHAFLYDWTACELHERLADITRDFSSVLLCGDHTARYFTDRFPQAIHMPDPTPETLAAYPAQFDMIIVMGVLHHVNDVPGILIQMRRALKPDGVLMGAFAGGETLYELRAALMQAEMDCLGGASPRVYPFIDKQHMAGLMQRAGFALPVVDSDVMRVSYRDMFHVISDVRGMGESNALVDRYTAFTSSKLFFTAAHMYQDSYAEPDGRVTASYEIIFLIGWAPHESQQQPARRGSGQVSLTECL